MTTGLRPSPLMGQNGKKPAGATLSATYQCPFCGGGVFEESDASHTCVSCHLNYPVRQGQPDFRLSPPLASSPDTTEAFQHRLKQALRRYPRFYRFLVVAIGPSLLRGPSSQAFVDALPEGARTLSVGAGVLRLRGHVTHLDYEPYGHLDVVGDAHHLPFREGVFDAVVCESLLEHVVEPTRVIAEMRRVLKPGGKIYLMVPFLFGFHAAPNDFYRFTHRGLEHRMQGFATDAIIVSGGPASALTGVLVETLAMAFSLGSRRLYQLLSVAWLPVLAPLKLLDYALCRHPEAVRAAAVLLYLGTKR